MNVNVVKLNLLLIVYLYQNMYQLLLQIPKSISSTIILHFKVYYI